MNPPAPERGAALLSVLMLVAVIAVIAALSLERMRIATRQSINLAAMDQARAYGFAAEALATIRIGDMIARDAAKTTLAGGWLGRDIPFPIDEGTARATLTDGGNCFNVNSIVTGQSGQPLVARPTAISQFEALMVAIEIPSGDAAPIAVALADWVDSDSTPLPGGAEDASYGRATTPYRTANSMMADASEVRVLAGMTPAIYAKLRPWLCALPVTDLSPININTILREQAPLIAMLVPQRLDIGTVRRMIDARPQDGYGNAMIFWSLPALSGLTPSPEVIGQTQIKTRWFVLDLSVDLSGAELRETALIDGERAPARLVRRAYGDPS